MAEDVDANLPTENYIEKPEIDEEVLPLETRLVRDLYLSFRHSQGSATLQDMLFAYIARRLENEELGDIDELRGGMLKAIAKLKVPTEHTHEVPTSAGIEEPLTNSTAHSMTSGFEDELDKMIKVIEVTRWPDRFTNLSTEEKDRLANTKKPISELVSSITEGMIQKDIRFQRQERPDRTRSDRHASFIQMYCFGGVNPGSQDFSDLYGDVRRTLPNVPNFPALRGAWRVNHPNQDFQAQRAA